MPKYHVDQPITLYSGELILTAAQAAVRAHSLEAVQGKRDATSFWMPFSSRRGGHRYPWRTGQGVGAARE